ncbi:hypothetical protein Tco_0620058 [Tanacetum coccineum]
MTIRLGQFDFWVFGFGNHRGSKYVARAREIVGGQGVATVGIQCFNLPRCCLVYKLRKGVQLQAEQSDWLRDTDEEIDEQDLEATLQLHAKI